MSTGARPRMRATPKALGAATVEGFLVHARLH
jgi:hypothetical protein